MDAARFDLLSRSFSTVSRRGGLLAGMGTAVTAIWSRLEVQEAEA